MNNFRYVLNQRLNRIHLLTFRFFGAGFLGVVLSALASVARFPGGKDSDNSGTLEKGVMPSWTGEAGEMCVSTCVALLGPIYTNGGGAVNSSEVSVRPFSASSRESWLWLAAGWFSGGTPMLR